MEEMTVDFDSIQTKLWGTEGFYQNTHKKHTQSLISGESTTSYQLQRKRHD